MAAGPRVLIVGGTGGLVGRALRAELAADHRLVSLHRRPLAEEAPARIRWIPGDVRTLPDPAALLQEIEAIVNVVWYRTGPARLFQATSAGLSRLLSAARAAGVGRFVQISVPPAPPHLEATFPYLVYKREFDRELQESGISYRILRPTMLYGRGDVLLSVMLRTMHRYRFFPMFGQGEYHVSPLAAADLARVVRAELASTDRGTLDLGGPVRYVYRELTGAMFRALGMRPRYWRLSARGSVRLARTLERLGSSLLYAYEVEWLLSDLLGIAPYSGLGRPLERVEPYIQAEAARLLHRGG